MKVCKIIIFNYFFSNKQKSITFSWGKFISQKEIVKNFLFNDF